MSRKIDLSGQEFGYLTALEPDNNPENKRTKWICMCNCGALVSVDSYRLRAGITKSCGCKRYETKNKTHGMRHTRIYEIWCGVKKRCYNKNSKNYANYGGKGVAMCDEWRNDFYAFYLWSMDHGYKDDLMIDRINNSGDYSPENCRWITHSEQQRNRTNNIFIEKDGVKKTVGEWASEMNVNAKIAYQRYKRTAERGLPIDFEYIFSKNDQCKKPINQYTKDGSLIRKWESATCAGRSGFNRFSILLCCKGKSKTSGGYIWKYAEE